MEFSISEMCVHDIVTKKKIYIDISIIWNEISPHDLWKLYISVLKLLHYN